ncbi:hypothetical protein [Gordoniibacillus kamchatkensis]|uniref:hypothetical protein n=1 Tax=Gordoniibacillus kamchatkensis TaxID=1590651 RepID=UPI000A8775A4|nr:hypothetical protein [Paenibacillus sp. VKM B-2647]
MSHTHYRAKCPRCSHPNTLPIPAKQTRTTLDFVCSYAPPAGQQKKAADDVRL